MDASEHLDRLRECHKVGPGHLVDALSRQGFEEYRSQTIRSRCDRVPLGGFWQGLDRATGSVASVMWINDPRSDRAIVHVDIDGEVFKRTKETGMESWWSDSDAEVVNCLSERAMAPAEIGRRLGMSEAAATSLISLLAWQGKVRICLVASPEAIESVAVRSFWCPFREQWVTAEFREERPSRRRLAVNWCSTFTPPTSMSCGGQCRELDDFSEPADGMVVA